MNSILKVFSLILIGMPSVSFGQLLIPNMPFSSGQATTVAPAGSLAPALPLATAAPAFSATPIIPAPLPAVIPPVQSAAIPQAVTPIASVPAPVLHAPVPFTPAVPPAVPTLAAPIPMPGLPTPATPQPVNLFPQISPVLPNMLAPPIAQQNQFQFITSDESVKKEDEDKDKKNIYLNFENSDLSSFVNYMAELKSLNLIPDQTLEAAKISLTIREPLSINGAWNVFLTVLDTAGFAIVQSGDVWKVLPKDKKLNQPLPAYINIAADKLPDDDSTIRYVFFLTNIQVADIKTLLESMLSSPNVLVEQPQLNAFVITDKSLNIKAAVKLIQELDQEGLPEEVTVLRLKRANATDVKALLDSLIAKPEVNPIARLLGKVTEGTTSYFSPTTRIIPEERTNSLILLGNKKSNEKIIDFITNQIDTDLKGADSPLYIYELQYADATAVMEILREVTATPESSAGAQASKFGSIRGGVKYFKDMKFKVDKDGNRLIVSSPDKQDWKLLEKTIADLDKPQPQIVIESLIVMINVDDKMELGGAIRNKKEGQFGTNVDFQAAMLGNPSLQMDSTGSNPVSLLGNILTQVTASQGAALLSFGKQASVWGVLKVLKQLTNTSILQQPSVTVANKTQATIEVGEEQRVVQGTVVAGAGASNTGYQTLKAATKLNITPQINPDGLVRLDVELNIDQFTDSVGDRTTKEVKTNVTVADGQVLVLGGFVKTSTTETTNKVPILGDIPLLGWFFKSQQRSLLKQYTFVFLAPTIIKPRQSPGSGLYTKMKFHQATDDIEKAIETKRVKDPIHNWFFNPEKENYSHKVIDFANARYQPTTVDIRNDPYYRSDTTVKDTQSERSIALAPDTVATEPTPTVIPSGIDIDKENVKEEIKEIKKADVIVAPQALPAPEPQIVTAPIQPISIQPMTPAQPQFVPPLPTAQGQPTIIDSSEEQQALASLEKEITQRRKALKESLAAPTRKPTNDNTSLVEKRKTFKDFLTNVPRNLPQTASHTDQEKPDSFSQRNRLKDFLAHNPAIALNNHSKKTSGRKGSTCC